MALPSAEEEEKKAEKGGTLLESNSIYQTASKIRCAYVHISKAIDNDSDKDRTPEALFAKKFALNTKISKLRIISSGNWMDDILSCATANSIVTSAVLTHTDLQPGVIYRAVPVIANLDNGSVLVQLGMGVKGLIPAMHLFDKSMPADNTNASYRNKVRMEKYKVGKKIDVRCLMISPSEKKCVLTAKKGLISSDLNDPITQYPGIEAGRTATGFISRVSKQGIAITFYNNVFGRISARKLAEEMGVENPNDDYKVGDVIKAKIRRCFKKEDRETPDDDNDCRDSYILDLSLNMLSDDSENTTKEGNALRLIKLLEPGMILKAKSLKIVELVPSRERKDNSFLPGHAVVSIKCKHLSIKEEDKADKGSITCKLPYEHILDSYDEETIRSPESMDSLASKMLTVGKKIAQEALVLSVTNRNGSISTPILSLKPELVSTAKDVSETSPSQRPVALLPKPSTALFMGAYVRGYCVRLDPSYGAFIRFLGGLTAIVPKLKGGLEISLYDTVLCKIAVVDLTNDKAPKILLKRVHSLPQEKSKKKKKKDILIANIIKTDDVIGDVKIENINFARAAVTLLNKKFEGANVKARIHMTMAKPVRGSYLKMPINTEDDGNDENDEDSANDEKITKYHPFSTWQVGGIIKDVRCVAIDVRQGLSYLELTNRDDEKNRSSNDYTPLFFENPSLLTTGTAVTGLITSIAKQNKGLWLQICPGINGFIPGLELSDDVEVLNNLKKYFKVGGRVSCCVAEADNKSDNSRFKHDGVRLSVLGIEKNIPQKEKFKKPVRGDLVLGRVNRFIKEHHAPALMIQLPGGYLGRCDITELEEPDDWDNMPLGRSDLFDKNEKPKDGDALPPISETGDESENDDADTR